MVGSLPFDEETVSLLYKKIEQGNYSIPKKVGPIASDLIARMLQVDPCKRIKIAEIKNHPWLKSEIPIYNKITNSFSLEKEEEF